MTKKISTFNCCESGGTSEDASVMEAEHADDGISPCGMKHRPGEFCVCDHPDFLQ